MWKLGIKALDEIRAEKVRGEVELSDFGCVEEQGWIGMERMWMRDLLIRGEDKRSVNGQVHLHSHQSRLRTLVSLYRVAHQIEVDVQCVQGGESW
jgi:hypothetical protein